MTEKIFVVVNQRKLRFRKKVNIKRVSYICCLTDQKTLSNLVIRGPRTKQVERPMHTTDEGRKGGLNV